MREILFRGKDLHKKEWVYGNLFISEKVHENGYDYCIMEISANCRTAYVKKRTIGQYTGLQDKNGNKIFEGDILSYTADGTTDYYEVKIDDGSVRFGELEETLDQQCALQFEVFGNIHDNPLFSPSRF